MFEFEWDESKESANMIKHGISFSDASTTFVDPDGFPLIDLKHSTQETRMYWIGKDETGRVLTTWFTWREDNIRIIGSAQFRKYRRLYFENTKTKRFSL